jgi:N12 class adenine-specific DNA methylase
MNDISINKLLGIVKDSFNTATKNHNSKDNTELDIKRSAYFRMMIVKNNSVNLDKLKNYAIETNNSRFYTNISSECKTLEELNILKFNSNENKYTFTSEYRRKKLFEFIQEQTNQIEKNNPIYFTNDLLALKAFLAFGTILDNKTTIEKFLKTASSLNNFSFHNCILIHSQLNDEQHKNIHTITKLQTFRQWSNTKNKQGKFVKIQKGSKAFKTINTGTKNNIKVNYEAILFDVSQTNARELDIDYTKQTNLDIYYKELLYSLENNNNISIDTSNLSALDSIEDKVIVLTESIVKYFHINQNEKEIVQYLLLEPLNLNQNLDIFTDENIREQLENSVNSFKQIYHNLHIESIILQSNNSDNIYYKVGEDDRKAISSNRIDHVEANKKAKNLKENISIEAATSYQEGYKHNKEETTNDRTRINQTNKELQSGQPTSDVTESFGRVQARPIQSAYTGEELGGLFAAELYSSSTGDESINIKGDGGERSLGNDKRELHTDPINEFDSDKIDKQIANIQKIKVPLEGYIVVTYDNSFKDYSFKVIDENQKQDYKINSINDDLTTVAVLDATTLQVLERIEYLPNFRKWQIEEDEFLKEKLNVSQDELNEMTIKELNSKFFKPLSDIDIKDSYQLSDFDISDISTNNYGSSYYKNVEIFYQNQPVENLKIEPFKGTSLTVPIRLNLINQAIHQLEINKNKFANTNINTTLSNWDYSHLDFETLPKLSQLDDIESLPELISIENDYLFIDAYKNPQKYALKKIDNYSGTTNKYLLTTDSFGFSIENENGNTKQFISFKEMANLDRDLTFSEIESLVENNKDIFDEKYSTYFIYNNEVAQYNKFKILNNNIQELEDLINSDLDLVTNETLEDPLVLSSSKYKKGDETNLGIVKEVFVLDDGKYQYHIYDQYYHQDWVKDPSVKGSNIIGDTQESNNINSDEITIETITNKLVEKGISPHIATDMSSKHLFPFLKKDYTAKREYAALADKRNPVTRELFTELTGIKLHSTQNGSKIILDNYTGDIHTSTYKIPPKMLPLIIERVNEINLPTKLYTSSSSFIDGINYIEAIHYGGTSIIDYNIKYVDGTSGILRNTKIYDFKIETYPISEGGKILADKYLKNISFEPKESLLVANLPFSKEVLDNPDAIYMINKLSEYGQLPIAESSDNIQEQAEVFRELLKLEVGQTIEDATNIQNEQEYKGIKILHKDLVRQQYLKSVESLKSHGNKNYINMLNSYNEDYNQNLAPDDIKVDVETFEQSKLASMKILNSLDNINIELIEEHNRLFNDNLNYVDFLTEEEKSEEEEIFKEVNRLLELEKTMDFSSRWDFELDKEKLELSVSNLHKYYDTKAIENRFINNSVTWEIFGNKYLFNLKDEIHLDLLIDTLQLKDEFILSLKKDITQEDIATPYLIEEYNTEIASIDYIDNKWKTLLYLYKTLQLKDSEFTVYTLETTSKPNLDNIIVAINKKMQEDLSNIIDNNLDENEIFEAINTLFKLNHDEIRTNIFLAKTKKDALQIWKTIIDNISDHELKKDYKILIEDKFDSMSLLDTEIKSTTKNQNNKSEEEDNDIEIHDKQELIKEIKSFGKIVQIPIIQDIQKHEDAIYEAMDKNINNINHYAIIDNGGISSLIFNCGYADKTFELLTIDANGFVTNNEDTAYDIHNGNHYVRMLLDYLPVDIENIVDKISKQRQENFTIESEIAIGGAKTKFKNNIAAIEVIRKVEDNQDITQDDKIKLSKYVGWGGISQAFYKPDGTTAKGWKNEAAELKEIMTPKELEQAQRSVLDSYYTDEIITKAMWKAIDKFGFKGGSVLEPSVGVGNFFGYMPKHLKPNSQLLGVELDSTTSKIVSTLYPKAKIYNMGYEDLKLNDESVSLAIGNPPYGQHRIIDKENKNISNLSIHNYFMAKTIDKLEVGGVMAMVISNSFLDSQDTTTRVYIGEKANLISAIRLPNNAFSKSANTEVTTDIVFFQKAYPGSSTNLQDWLFIGEVNDTPINKYFEKNQKNLLGTWGKYGTMYQGDSPALVAKQGQNTKELLDQAINNLPIYTQWNQYDRKYDFTKYYSETTKPIMDLVGVNNSLAKELQTINGDTMTSDARINTFFINDDKIYQRLPDFNEEARVKEITTRLNSKGEEVLLKDREIARIKGMIKVSTVANKLKNSQLDVDVTEDTLDTLRTDLNNTYDNFVKEFGFLSSSTNKKLFEVDVNSSFLLALEKDYDKGISAAVSKRTGEKVKKESAKKADIFSKRTQSPYIAPTSASSYEDALLICLGEQTYVDMNYMSQLLNKNVEDIEKYLNDKNLIYEDPNYGWVTAEEYLSGNVKEKLKETNNPKNIEALKLVIPKDIAAIDISIQAGASWIPQNDIKDFISHITGDISPSALYTSINAQWNITTITDTEKEEKYGTRRVKARSILEATLNNKLVTVYDTIETDDGGTRREVNQEDTFAANDKLELVKSEWDNWIWESSERRDRLAKLYNDKFNVYTKRNYDGSSLTFPGKVDHFKLRPHQINFAWRVLQGESVLADHVVGTGKTASAVVAAMELKRTGKAKKPLIVVPNHLVQQWGKEWLELYPNANILVPTKQDFEAKRRKILMSRIATGNYDAVIIAHSQLAKIENDRDFEIGFIKEQIEDIKQAINALRREDNKNGLTIKRWQTMKNKLISQTEELLETRKDDNITFLDLGIDTMIIDEAHEFKNLQFHTSLQRVAGLGNPQGSKKAFDLFIKTQALLEKTNNKNLIFLTGTPISNTLAEMFTMQRYLQSTQLKANGLNHFDAWVKQYAKVTTDWELSPSGKYKLNTRLATFKNIPELIAAYNQFSDVVTREYINEQLALKGEKLPVPRIRGGKPENIILERSDDQANYIGIEDENGEYPKKSLVYRSENLPKGKLGPGDDNMLVIMSEARKASLDMRILDDSYSDYESSKANETVRRCLEIYNKWNDKKGTQLIFCDLSTPKGAVASEKARIDELIKNADNGDEKAILELDKLSQDELFALQGNFSVYDEIKAKLIKANIPESEIAFIHDAKTDLQKQTLYGRVNSGNTRFLLGSTQKMGSGMNVQKRIVAVHHLDAPWRPSDLEQREGRAIRQGNLLYNEDPEGFEIEILRYATENTLDSRMWQTIESKARFIEQIKAGNITDREVEDIAGEAANAAEMKAAASGNPLYLEEITLKQEIKKISAIKKEHFRANYDREAKIENYARKINNSSKHINSYEKDIARYNNYKLSLLLEQKEIEEHNKKNPLDKKDKSTDFNIILDDKKFTKREDAGAYIIKSSREFKKQYDAEKSRNTEQLIGEFAGFEVAIHNSPLIDWKMSIILRGERDYEVDFSVINQKAGGLITKMTNQIKNIDNLLNFYLDEIDLAKKELPRLQNISSEFPREEELSILKQRHSVVIQELQAKNKDTNEQAQEEESTKINTKIINIWIDDNKSLSAFEILENKRLDPEVLTSLDTEVVGKCLVLNDKLEIKEFLRVIKIAETFGGKWDKKSNAIVFSDDGILRINELLGNITDGNVISLINNTDTTTAESDTPNSDEEKAIIEVKEDNGDDDTRRQR